MHLVDVAEEISDGNDPSGLTECNGVLHSVLVAIGFTVSFTYCSA